jgi:hypothetical protein
LTRPAQPRLFVSIATAALCVTTVACGDSTDPGARVDVAVAVDYIVGPNVNQAPADGNRVACQVTMSAIATGKGTATWGAATLKWYGGKDRSIAFDSSSAPAIDVGRAWGASSIAAGGRQTTTWDIWASVPFSGAIEFQYRVAGGPDRTASLKFDCGPAIVPGADPPSITEITAYATTPDLEPGGVLKVYYTATSPIGVWQTAVLVSGPCEVYQEFDETLGKTASRLTAITIPSTCEPGAPVDVTVYATDAVLDRRARQVSSSYKLVDKTPPWLRSTTVPRPSGPYFTGDTIDFVVEAGDNHRVSSIAWEVRPFGAQDSVVSPPAGQSVKVRIPVQPSWSGPAELRYVARDASGLASDTIVSAMGSVAVLPAVNRPVTLMEIDDYAGGSADEVVDLKRGVVYLMQQGRRQISVMSLASMKIVSTIPLSLYPANIDLTSSGDSLLVALTELGALGTIDLRRTDRRLEIMTIDPNAGWPFVKPSSISEVRSLANGKAFLVVPSDVSVRRLLELDLATGAQRYRFDVGGIASGGLIGGSFIEGPLLTRSGDGSAMSVRAADCVQRYDAASDQFSPCIKPETSGEVSSADASGQRFAIGPDLYDAGWRHLRRIGPLPAGSGFGSSLTPDGHELYLPYAGGLVRANADDGRILDGQRLPVRPNRVRVSPDGRFVVAAGSSVATGNPAVAIVTLR